MIRTVLALLLLATSARADQNALFDRWIAAAGGRQRLESVAAVHRLDAIDEDGMPGVREEWTTSALQRRERLSHTRDEAITVYDGTHGWRRDWNGFVENLAGADLRAQSDLAMIHSFAALTGAGGARRKWMGCRSIAARTRISRTGALSPGTCGDISNRKKPEPFP